LTPTPYRRWLDDRAISYVAVADAKLDYIATDEVDLIDRGLPYLHPMWRSDHWTLYRVRHPEPLVGPAGARLDHLGAADFSLAVRRPGSYLVRVHYTPYWAVSAGSACVARDGDWTRVDARSRGAVTVSARLSLDGFLRHEGPCSG